jgi:hypothetical protein
MATGRAASLLSSPLIHDSLTQDSTASLYPSGLNLEETPI